MPRVVKLAYLYAWAQESFPEIASLKLALNALDRKHSTVPRHRDLEPVLQDDIA